jgi:antitoxin ChpS
MDMKLNIQKWGNSAAIRLPATMLTQIGATIGDAIEVDPQAFRVAKPKYKLADLLAQCNKNAQPPADMATWESTSPIGAEIL